MTRNGKIARLPRHIRIKLNRRLDDGEVGKDLVDWLNALDDVKDILSSEFAGRPISEQNLTEWKQGGFLDWQRQEEACERLRNLVEFSDNLNDATEDFTIPSRLADVLAAQLAAETLKLLEETPDPRERFQHVCAALGQLHKLRASDHAADRLRIDMERWEIECEQREQKEMDNMVSEARAYATAPIRQALKRPTVVAAFGGGKAGEKIADFLNEINEKCARAKSRWPDADLPPFDSTPLDQAKIKPDQAKSN